MHPWAPAAACNRSRAATSSSCSGSVRGPGACCRDAPGGGASQICWRPRSARSTVGRAGCPARATAEASSRCAALQGRMMTSRPSQPSWRRTPVSCGWAGPRGSVRRSASVGDGASAGRAAEAAEGPDGGLGAVVALGGLLARQARHHGVVTLVQLWMVPARRQAAGGQAAGQHLEEQHADREQVALHGGPKAAPLLWRHVGDRADSSGRDRGLSFA